MNMKKLVLWMVTALISTSSFALSESAQAGKLLIPACDSCHNQANNPPLGPPLWSVQRVYKINSDSNADFIERMVSFVKAPTIEAAIHSEGLKSLGLMPAVALPDQMLADISAYILEEKFPPPCDHWKIAIDKATAAGDMSHVTKDQAQFDKYCK